MKFSYLTILATASTVVGVTFHYDLDDKQCLDISGGQLTAGTSIEIWNCNGLPSQEWTVNPSQVAIHVASVNQLCLDAGADPEPGSNVHLETCDTNVSSQRFAHTSAGSIKLDNGKDLCIGVPHSSTLPGTYVELAVCDESDNSQIWQSK